MPLLLANSKGRFSAAPLGLQVGWSAYTKATTGSGLPAGPSGLLGAVEGFAYLSLLAGKCCHLAISACQPRCNASPALQVMDDTRLRKLSYLKKRVRKQYSVNSSMVCHVRCRDRCLCILFAGLVTQDLLPLKHLLKRAAFRCQHCTRCLRS